MVGEELAMLVPHIKLFIAILVILFIWEAVWKVIAMWKSARRNQLVWFICITIFNTVGILSIVYLLFFQKNKNKQKAIPKSRKRRKK